MKTLIKKIGKKVLISTGFYAPIVAWHNKRVLVHHHKKKEVPILSFKRRFGIDVFIETGTYRGEMVDAMKNNFKEVYSIELADNFYNAAVEKFALYANVHLIHGDSARMIPEVLKKIHEPAIFWLDAHYMGPKTARGKLDTPIKEELTAIFNHPIKKHAIIIDDALDFNGTNDYPTKDAVKALVPSNDYEFEVVGDYLKIYPKSK
jgi:hypothetical protein